MNVSELLDKVYGTKTTYDKNPERDDILVTKVRFLDYNPRRLSFVLINLGDYPVSVGPDSDITLTRGIYLVPHGGTLSMVWTEDFEMPTLEWYGIADGGTSEIYVLEVLTQ